MKQYLDFAEDYFEKQERIEGSSGAPRVRPDRVAQRAAREAEKKMWNDSKQAVGSFGAGGKAGKSPPPPSGPEKKQICQFFAKTGTCRFGDQCKGSYVGRRHGGWKRVLN